MKQSENEKEKRETYEVNGSFDVLENGGGALIICGIVAVVPLNVLGLHGLG